MSNFKRMNDNEIKEQIELMRPTRQERNFGSELNLKEEIFLY